MPKATDKGPSEADIIFNRANVALARSQRLIQSWLPAKTAEEIASTKTEEQLQKEDEELFKPAPELLGVGAAVPDNDQDALVKRRGPSNQKLLEQLLGKKAAKGHIASKAPTRNSQQTSQEGRQPLSKPVLAEDSDDEEEGRASMVASKGARRTKRTQTTNQKLTRSETTPAQVEDNEPLNVQVGDEQVARSAPTQVRRASPDEDEPRPTKKRAMSYLDQLLAEKANKKKKKQKGGV